jgi:hypothetical protein
MARAAADDATLGDDDNAAHAAPRGPHTLRFASALSRRRTVAGCLEETVGACLASLGRDAPPPDVVRCAA